MRVLATQYTLVTKSFEIYLAGCKGKNGVHCRGCHNPLSWDFNQGDFINNHYINNIVNKINSFDILVENIWILGGEPLDNDRNELIDLTKKILCLNKPIWLFTRYNFNEVKNILKEDIVHFAYIKCGEYNEDLKTDNNVQYGIKLSTTNQRIFKKGVDY